MCKFRVESGETELVLNRRGFTLDLFCCRFTQQLLTLHSPGHAEFNDTFIFSFSLAHARTPSGSFGGA